MKKFFLPLLFLLSLKAEAQNKNLYFDHIGIKEGLPENFVRAIVQDGRGYMWLGTQNGLVRYDGYQYKVYYLGDEKSNQITTTNVISLYVDVHQKLWVSTKLNGLFCYNVTNDSFEQFAYQGTHIVYFSILSEDKDHNFWGLTGTGAGQLGVARYNLHHKQIELFGNKEKGAGYINATQYYTVQTAADGKVWIGTNNGLYRYNGSGKPLTGFFASTDTATQIAISPVYEAPSQPGIFWINTFHGDNLSPKLYAWDYKNNRVKEYKAGQQPYSIKTAVIFNVYEDKHRQLWFATDSGLSRLDRATGRFTNYVSKDTLVNATKDQFSEFVEGKDGSFWLSSPAGLVHFDPVTGIFQRYLPDVSKPGSINSLGISCKYIDGAGALWVGFNHAGANKVNKYRSAFKLYQKDPGTKDGFPFAATFITPVDHGHNLINNEVAIYDWQLSNNTFKKLYTSPAGEQLRSTIICARDGRLYFSTTKGLRVYDPARNETVLYSYNPADNTSIVSNLISDVYQDHYGTIWLASSDHGVCSYDPILKKFTRYPYRNDAALTTAKNNGKLDDGGVHRFYEDRENTLWVGTNFGSLNRFDSKGKKFFSYFSYSNRAMACSTEILEDRSGRFWVGNYLEGLFLFDRAKGLYSRHFNEKNGLLFNSVLSLQEDAEGDIWLYTERGLSRINGRTLSIKNFPLEEILPGYELPIVGRCFRKLDDGRFALTLKTGLAVFDPKDLDDDRDPPIVHLEAVVHNNSGAKDNLSSMIIPYGNKEIELPYNENRIRFDYVGLQYENPEGNIYAYKLDGYDKNWVKAGTQRSVTYNNLSPGRYLFHISAANSSGVWDKKGDSVIIVIHSPWWFTVWAWVLYAILFIASIYAFVTYRSRRLLHINRVLEHKVHIRTEEVMQQKEEIEAQRDNLEKAFDELKVTQTQLVQREKMASLGELTAGIAHEIQNPLNFVNNFSEVSIELLDELKQEVTAGNAEDTMSIANDLSQNLQKISHHGKRADFIVKGMLEHSRSGTGEKQPTDVNMLVEEFLKLSYHGLRAKDKDFNADLLTNFDDKLPKVSIVQQGIGRVLLNLFNNAFYAVNERRKTAGADYKPTVEAATRIVVPGDWIEISVKDNGNGIPNSIREKIMQPFFTTKPTGEGTGLGLSLSYDIVVKGHGGKIDVTGFEGEGATFTIALPVI